MSQRELQIATVRKNPLCLKKIGRRRIAI